jgi:hypothetical protein
MRTEAASPVPSYIDQPSPELRLSSESRAAIISGAPLSSERINQVKAAASASSSSSTAGSYDNSPSTSASPYPRQRSYDLPGGAAASSSAVQWEGAGGMGSYGSTRAYMRDMPG